MLPLPALLALAVFAAAPRPRRDRRASGWRLAARVARNVAAVAGALAVLEVAAGRAYARWTRPLGRVAP